MLASVALMYHDFVIIDSGFPIFTVLVAAIFTLLFSCGNFYCTFKTDVQTIIYRTAIPHAVVIYVTNK